MKKTFNLKQPYRITQGRMSRPVNGGAAEFERRAEQCAAGELASMRWMSETFQEQMSAQTRETMYCLLAGESESALETWRRIMKENEEERFLASAYGFWVCRAAVFGDSASRKRIHSAPILREIAKLNDEFQSPLAKKRYSALVRGDEMARMGLIDFRGLPTLDLSPLNQNRLYVGNCYSGYTGRDETGFGMEEEYDFYYFDENFRFLMKLEGLSNLDIRNNEERIFAECVQKRKALAEKQYANAKKK
ncbi:MAG: hypothetical protein IJ074_04895 [Clostridia bacterium]|nr:hypothetical protein [Clostridia bacterium]